MTSLLGRRAGAALLAAAISLALALVAAVPANADRGGSYSHQMWYGQASVNFYVHSWIGRIVLNGAVRDTHTDGRRVRLEVRVHDARGSDVGPLNNADSTGAWKWFQYDLAPFWPSHQPHTATRLCRVYGQWGTPHDCSGWQSTYW